MYFCREVLGYKDLVAPIHEVIGDKLQSDFTRGLVLIPRGNLKTCQVSIGWTIWMWLQNPNIRFGIGSATETLAIDIASEIKAHISENPKFVELFGDWTDKSCWTQNKINIKPRTIFRKDKSLTTFSVGKDPTGKHFDIIILDDVANRANSSSPEMRAKQISLYRDCKNLIVADETKGVIVLVGTRWHFGDIYNYIVSNPKIRRGFDFIIDEPCITNATIEKQNPDRWRSQIKLLLKHPDSKVLFPSKFSIKDLKQKYIEDGTYEFSCQQMNFPTSDEASAFKAEDIRFVKDTPAGLLKYILTDTAGDQSVYEDADDWASVSVSIGTGGVLRPIYILGCIAESHISSNKFLDLLALENETYEPYKLIIEKNFSKTYINIFREKYPKLKRKIFGVTVGNQKTKTQRIFALQPYVENECLIFVEDKDGEEYPFMGRIVKLSPGKIKLLEQLIDYGNTNHDDCADALALILAVIKPPQKQQEDPKYSNEPYWERTGY